MDLTKEYNDIHYICKELDNIVFDKKNLSISVDIEKNKRLLTDLSNKVDVFRNIMKHIEVITENYDFDFCQPYDKFYDKSMNTRLRNCLLSDKYKQRSDVKNYKMIDARRLRSIGKKTLDMLESFLILHNIDYTK